MTRPLLLDLFCGQGGAAKGYHDAGFDVVGVDIADQPRYPYHFIQGDALEVLADVGGEFDAIHASPPCQAFSSMRHAWNAKQHPDMIEPSRFLLNRVGRPWIVENVVGSPLNSPVLLCGSMFSLGIPGYQLRRHRLFESSHLIQSSGKCSHTLPTVGIYGDHLRDRRRNIGGDFPDGDKVRLAGDALGVDWMDWRGLSQSIPPAYTRFIGEQLLAHINEERRAA